MRIHSPAFADGADIPVDYSCDGKGINPPLVFSDVPAQAKSLALIMDDIDVPPSNRPDGIWNHWLLWNIPPNCRGIFEASEPPGISGHTTGGETDYQPPCPPDREHRYVFRLFALDRVLDLDYESTRHDTLLSAIAGHILAEAELTGRYDLAERRKTRTGRT